MIKKLNKMVINWKIRSHLSLSIKQYNFNRKLKEHGDSIRQKRTFIIYEPKPLILQAYTASLLLKNTSSSLLKSLFQILLPCGSQKPSNSHLIFFFLEVYAHLILVNITLYLKNPYFLQQIQNPCQAQLC